MLVNLKEILAPAKEYGFAVPAFNIANFAMFGGVMSVCEQTNSPVIIEIHPNELNHIGPYMVKGILEQLVRSHIPACLHLDHGAAFDQIILAIRLGFTSVMIDGSLLPYCENVELCRKVVQAAHAVGVSVEGELGTIGIAASCDESGTNEIEYTRPQEAKAFVKDTGVDALAVAIGTSHGLYPKGIKPKLRLDLLREIVEVVDVPLVLHGGSNNPDDEISSAVKIGVSKVNIASDIKQAYYQQMRIVLKDNKILEPKKIQTPCIESMCRMVEYKLHLLDTMGKADYYR